MKKVFLSLAVVFGVAMVSCGGHKTAEETDTMPVEEVAVAADEAVVADSVSPDSVQLDTVVAVAVENAEPAQ